MKWFGYGDKITLDKLIRTDNDLYNQYVHDNLSLNNDIIKGFENFVNTSLFTLVIKENEDIGIEDNKRIIKVKDNHREVVEEFNKDIIKYIIGYVNKKNVMILQFEDSVIINYPIQN